MRYADNAVGVQGEWGSGKTSLLKMIQATLEKSDFCMEVVRIKKKSLIKGKNAFSLIWINTWEESLLKTPEECFPRIIESIIDGIIAETGNLEAYSAENCTTYSQGRYKNWCLNVNEPESR